MPAIKLSANLQIYTLDENPSCQRTVILLHGLGADCTSWQLQVPALVEADFRVVAPDMRGFGGSSYPHERLSIRTYASDLVALMDELQLASATLVGISMGGTIALQTTLDYPTKVTRLVLANTFARLASINAGTGYTLPGDICWFIPLAYLHRRKIVSERLFPNPEQAEFRELFMQQGVNPTCRLPGCDPCPVGL